MATSNCLVTNIVQNIKKEYDLRPAQAQNFIYWFKAHFVRLPEIYEYDQLKCSCAQCVTEFVHFFNCEKVLDLKLFIALLQLFIVFSCSGCFLICYFIGLQLLASFFTLLHYFPGIVFRNHSTPLAGIPLHRPVIAIR